MMSIDDEEDHNHRNVCRRSKNATLQKLSAKSYDSTKPNTSGNSSSSNKNKRNITYLHFLRKTRRKSNKHSFKATSPTTNVRKSQALIEYWQKLLMAHKKSFSEVTQVNALSFHNTKSLENLHVRESAAIKCLSNTPILNKQRSFENMKYSCEMKQVCSIVRSRSEPSLSSKSIITSKLPLSCSSESGDLVKAERKHSSKPSSKNCHNASNKRSRSDWSDINSNYIIISNNLEPNGSYIRRPHSIERLCTRKKGRLRRRRKRKEFHCAEHLINRLVASSEQQLANTFSSTESTLNAQQESHKASTDSHAQPEIIATKRHNMLKSMPTIAEISPMEHAATAQKYMLPATETFPKFSDSHKHRNKNCCSGNAAAVQQQSKSGNSSPAVRSSAFYAVTTLRLFLTTLTTLIASTTPTTFTATKYSWIFLWIYVNLTARGEYSN